MVVKQDGIPLPRQRQGEGASETVGRAGDKGEGEFSHAYVLPQKQSRSYQRVAPAG
jgi:hypothetical protein